MKKCRQVEDAEVINIMLEDEDIPVLKRMLVDGIPIPILVQATGFSAELLICELTGLFEEGVVEEELEYYKKIGEYWISNFSIVYIATVTGKAPSTVVEYLVNLNCIVLKSLAQDYSIDDVCFGDYDSIRFTKYTNKVKKPLVRTVRPTQSEVSKVIAELSLNTSESSAKKLSKMVNINKYDAAALLRRFRLGTLN